MIKLDQALIAIRAKCLDCSGGSRNVVEDCLLKDCPLYPYRSVSAINEEEAQMEGQISMFDAIEGEKHGKRIRNPVL